MTGIVTTPWTDDQVASLNAYQAAGHFHPYTCGRRDPDGADHVLVATPAGWACPKCAAAGVVFHQDWAHAATANGAWAEIARNKTGGTRE